MNRWLVGAAIAGSLLAQPGVVLGQSGTVVDLKNLKPREVRSTVFTLSSAQDLKVDAVGAEAASQRSTFSWVSTMFSGKDDARDPWMGNAWILDLKSRRTVWELSAASTERGNRSTRVFSGTVHLPPGSYEAFYAAFPTMYWTDENGNQDTSQRFLSWLTDQGFDDFKLTIHGTAHVLTGTEANRARDEFESGAIVALHGAGTQKFLQSGFVLDRSTDVDLYVEGEAREDTELDTGWIINADTRATIVRMTWRDSAPAGGAQKNRMMHVTRTLAPGRYAAFYATDDSHDSLGWNAPPPHDPDSWGLLLRVNDPAARAAVKPFTYEHVPSAATIVALTGIGDRESRSRAFTLNRAMDVRVYALGEGRDGRMFDYGWITNNGSHQKVWEMRHDQTENAGGDVKNRLVDRTIHLDKGDYVVHYVSDDSHSAAGFNAPAPPDGKHWGITLLAASGTLERGVVTETAERSDPNLVAQLVGVRDDERPKKAFTLDRETALRIYALGEGSGRSLVDYGWIEDAKTGRTVWEMTYRTTEHAGGATKNRRFDGTITLPAGQYTLRYESDDSHSFGSWNADPPDDPDMWGITIYRAGGR